MLERIKDCLCHPKNIGRYHKDKVIIVFLTMLIFFIVYLAILGTKTFSEPYFEEGSYNALTSSVIRSDNPNASYDSTTHVLSGESCLIKGNNYSIVVLPKENISFPLNSITIVLNETLAEVYYSDVKVSSIEYKDIKCSNFSLLNVKDNIIYDTYNFRIFSRYVLESSSAFFKTMIFLSDALSVVIYYLAIALALTIYARLLNPTIDRNIRFKLCFYDGLVYFVGACFACLFDIQWLSYVTFILPLIYATITFRHIIKVVVKKDNF